VRHDHFAQAAGARQIAMQGKPRSERGAQTVVTPLPKDDSQAHREAPAALAGTVMVMSLAWRRLGTTAAMYSVPCCVSSTAFTLPSRWKHS